MATSFNPGTSGAVNHKTLLPLLLLLFCFAISRQTADGQQRSNASDWHVPPPKPGVKPVRGQRVKPVSVSFIDVAAPVVPIAPTVDVPQLAAISVVPPDADNSGQPDPAAADFQAIPMPAAPEVPPMPQRTMQDLPLPQRLDVPAPPAPEMPGMPAEPTPNLNTINTKNTMPLLPAVTSQPVFVVPLKLPVSSWSTPGIPENDNFRMAAPSQGINSGTGKQNGRPKKQKSK